MSNNQRPTVTELWEQWHAPLLRFLRYRTRDYHHADDLLQEVFLRVHRRWESLRSPERSMGWLWQIARNVVVDAYRQQRNDAPLTEDLIITTGLDDETNTLQQLAHCLPPLMQQLSQADREALERTAFDGMSQHDLSVALGMSFSGLKARVQRARSKLKALLLACCAVTQDTVGRLSGYQPSAGTCGANTSTSGDESFCGDCRHA